MNRGKAIDIIIKRVHEDMADTALRTLAEEWLNEIMHDISSRSSAWSWLEDEATLALVNGTSSYNIDSIASNIDSIQTITIEDPPLTFKPKNVFTFTVRTADPDDQSGTPQIYTIWERNLLFYPVPDENESANVRYYKQTADITSDAQDPPWGNNPFLDRVWITGGLYLALHYFEDLRWETVFSLFNSMAERAAGKGAMHEEDSIISSNFSFLTVDDDIDHDPTGFLAGLLL